MASYAFHLYVRDWPEITEATSVLDRELRAQKRFVAADTLVRAYGRLFEDLEKLALTVAATGTRELRDKERSTRVRPDTGGAGGPRLGDSLQADPLKVIPGSVGVANEDVLDQAVPWWITNEVGSTARVGGRIFGTFIGGSAGDQPPDPSQFREHALFSPTPAIGGGGPGTIQNPIPARRFIREAIPVIEAEWRAGFAKAKARFDGELDIVLGTRK